LDWTWAQKKAEDGIWAKTGLRIVGFRAYTLSSSPTVELPVYKDENGV